jgi:hypothetical protein
MNRELEAQTRKQRIDPRLKAAEWSIAGFDADAPLSSYRRTAVKEYETRTVRLTMLCVIKDKSVVLLRPRRSR